MRISGVSQAAVAGLAFLAGALAGCGGDGESSDEKAGGATAAPETVRTCLRDAGLRVVGSKRSEGDENAPDFELIVGDRPDAFVAFYDDLGRAERFASLLRGNAERIGGSVDRHGKISVLWVDDPSGDLRDQVEGCIL